MVLGSETDSTFANFNYECGPGRETSWGRVGDNTPSPTYGRRAVPAQAALQIKSSLARSFHWFLGK